MNREPTSLAGLFAATSHLPDKMADYSDRRIPVGQATRGLDLGSLTGLARQVLDVSPASLSTADLAGFPPSIARQSMIRSIGECEIRGTPHVAYVSDCLRQLIVLSGPFGKVERHRYIALDKFNNASKSMTKKWQKAMKKQAKAFTQ